MSRSAAVPDPHLRLAEIAIAILFLVTAAAAITGATLLAPAFEDPADLARIAANRAAIATGALLWTLNNVDLVFIALFAWPVLHPVAPFMARAYLTTRVIESGVMMFGVMALVTISGLAVSGLAVSGLAVSGLSASGNAGQVGLLQALSAICLDAGMLPLLGFSGLFLTWPLWRHRILPGWLAGLGVVGYVLVMLAGFFAWFGWIGIGTGDTGVLMVVTVALWEIVLMPIWLLWKGFARAA